MKAIKITSGSNIIKRTSNRFSNRDFNLLNSLAFIKGYKVSTTNKSIIINGTSHNLKKVNGFIYAGHNNLTAMMNDKVYSTNKFLLRLKNA